RYEIRVQQYVEFLNAKAASDPLALYNTNMSSGYGGITRGGSSGAYAYSAIAAPQLTESHGRAPESGRAERGRGLVVRSFVLWIQPSPPGDQPRSEPPHT